jgi:hypothetical protein
VQFRLADIAPASRSTDGARKKIQRSSAVSPVCLPIRRALAGDLFAVMKRKHVVWPTDTFQHAMRTRLPFDCPTLTQ